MNIKHRTCKVCDIRKKYIKINENHYDENGLKWKSYAICGACTNTNEDDAYLPTHHTSRKCRHCKKPIDLSRYYYCLICLPEHNRKSDAQDGFIYYPSFASSELVIYEV